jgi:hypothetical protein
VGYPATLFIAASEQTCFVGLIFRNIAVSGAKNIAILPKFCRSRSDAAGLWHIARASHVPSHRCLAMVFKDDKQGSQ